MILTCDGQVIVYLDSKRYVHNGLKDDLRFDTIILKGAINKSPTLPLFFYVLNSGVVSLFHYLCRDF